MIPIFIWNISVTDIQVSVTVLICSFVCLLLPNIHCRCLKRRWEDTHYVWTDISCSLAFLAAVVHPWRAISQAGGVDRADQWEDRVKSDRSWDFEPGSAVSNDPTVGRSQLALLTDAADKFNKKMLQNLLRFLKMLNWRGQLATGGDGGLGSSTLLYPVSLLAGGWDWVQGGNPLYAAVKCLSDRRGQIWRILINFFAKSTCHIHFLCGIFFGESKNYFYPLKWAIF